MSKPKNWCSGKAEGKKEEVQGAVSSLTVPCYCADEAEDLIKRIDGFIEYAEATRKFADMGFYKLVKEKMISMNTLLSQ
jgi:hypothetical protein